MKPTAGIRTEPARPRESREEIAKREIGRTDISPRLARAMLVLFLATILAVPAIQSILDVRGDGRSAADLNWPTWCRVDSLFLGVAQAYCKAAGGQFNRILAANGRLLKNIHEYESELEDESFLTTKLLGPTQYWLTRLGGLGNEKAYGGKDGWLFYRPGVDYVIGPGFLDRAILARRAAGGTEYTAPPRPDPRPAILDFQARLARSGVQLILMPAPTKSMIEPERFSARYRDGPDVLQNPSFEQFAAEMEASGVLVFDPAPVLLERKRETGR